MQELRRRAGAPQDFLRDARSSPTMCEREAPHWRDRLRHRVRTPDSTRGTPRFSQISPAGVRFRCRQLRTSDGLPSARATRASAPRWRWIRRVVVHLQVRAELSDRLEKHLARRLRSRLQRDLHAHGPPRHPYVVGRDSPRSAPCTRDLLLSCRLCSIFTHPPAKATL
jgi:hypothetical protein